MTTAVNPPKKKALNGPECPCCGSRQNRATDSGRDDAGHKLRRRVCQDCRTGECPLCKGRYFTTVEIPLPGVPFGSLDSERRQRNTEWWRKHHGKNTGRGGGKKKEMAGVLEIVVKWLKSGERNVEKIVTTRLPVKSELKNFRNGAVVKAMTHEPVEPKPESEGHVPPHGARPIPETVRSSRNRRRTATCVECNRPVYRDANAYWTHSNSGRFIPKDGPNVTDPTTHHGGWGSGRFVINP